MIFNARRAVFCLSFAALSQCLVAQTKPVFTEDFESGKLDPAVWEQRVPPPPAVAPATPPVLPTMAVEAADGAKGKYALHVHFPDGASANSYVFAVATHLPESVRTHFFGRVYMKVGAAYGAGHDPFIFAGEPGYPLSKFTEMGVYQNLWQPSYQENKSLSRPGRGEATYHSESGPPVDKWFLLEWEFNDDPSSITFWIDGEKVMTPVNGEKTDVLKFTWPKNSGTTSGLVGGYKELGLGTRVWGRVMTPFDVYYDDLAVGTARLGAAK